MKIKPLLQTVLAAFVLLVGICGAGMAMSLKLPSAAELSGKWRLSLQTQTSIACELRLETDTPQVSGDLVCAARWLREAPTGWFPTPDGLAFTGKEGTRLIQFNDLGQQHYEALLPDGGVLTLERIAE